MESSLTAPPGTQVRELQEDHLRNQKAAKHHPIPMILTLNPCHLDATLQNLQDGSIVVVDTVFRNLLD